MNPEKPLVLAVNGGSSSIKATLFRAGGALERVVSGGVERIGQPGGFLAMKGPAPGNTLTRPLKDDTLAAAIAALLDWVADRCDVQGLAAVGHRVVHGGPDHSDPVRIDAKVLGELQELSTFDPEHLPEEILLVRAFQGRFGSIPQVACFDTAFHRNLPRLARLLPIPRRYEARGVHRYGFHGLSYSFLLEELSRRLGAETAQGRVILAHLGSGASMAALHHGRSIDTSMGFTPSAGMPMGTRSGDLDPGLLCYLARTEGMTTGQFTDMIHFKSGLLGVSETSSDMRDLLLAEEHDPRAAEAVALFCYQARKWIGAFAASLGGLDTLVFSGGIGERSSVIRERICGELGFLGIGLDPELNFASSPVISTDSAKVLVCAIPTDEERVIARMTCQVLGMQVGVDDHEFLARRESL